MSTHVDYHVRISALEERAHRLPWWHLHTLPKRFVLGRYIAAARFRNAHGDYGACETLIARAEEVMNGDAQRLRKGLSDIISQRGTMSAG